ncbi:MAG TPA: YidB family protein [Gaiellaceae bacterium]|nr:YidB family protein [Gaiellaceae bacterium]
MSLTDEVKGLLGGQLGEVVQKFRDSDLDEQVSSWISKGENLPIAGDQIRKALGNETVAAVAAKLGIGQDEAADQLAQEVPKAIDEQTPEGTVPAQASA